MSESSNYCPSCGEPNNPTFLQCYKCGGPIELPQNKTKNGIAIFTVEQFMRATFGGRPSQMGMNDYQGHSFQCICENPHNFEADKVQVLRELAGMRLVFVCPDGQGVICAHLKGMFKFQGFETLFGAKS